MLSVLGDISVDSEASVVTSSISSREFAGSIFGGAHRGRVYARAFIGVRRVQVKHLELVKIFPEA